MSLAIDIENNFMMELGLPEKMTFSITYPLKLQNFKSWIIQNHLFFLLIAYTIDIS